MRRALLPFFLLILAAFAASELPAQTQPLQVQLVMSPNPSPYLSDWEQRRETATFRVINVGQLPRAFRIETKIYLNGSLKAQTRTSDMPVLTVQPASTAVYNAEQIIPQQAVQMQGDGSGTIFRTGRIPAGSYQVCTRLLDPQTGAPMTQDACASFTLTSYQPQQLLLPANASGIQRDQMQRVIFTWTPIMPQPPRPPVYIFHLFEVLPGQEPMQAFRANQPIVERQVVGQTQMLWPPEIVLERPGGRYIWSVRALDEMGRPIAEGDGYAAPFTFTHEDRTTSVPCRPPKCAVQVEVRRVTGTNAAGTNVAGGTVSGTTTAGSPLTFHATVAGDCPPGCARQVQVVWRGTLTAPDGMSTTFGGEGENFNWTPPGPGRLTVECSVVIVCGPSAPTTCTGGTSIDVTPRPTTTPRTTELRPPKDPEVPWVPGPELVPPDTFTTGDGCSMPPPKSDPGSSISLGMTLDRSATSPYPRAVPIRADAIDEDYAIFYCLYCGGPLAELWKPVRDGVRDFRWTLDGPGSLNTPFDVGKLIALDDEIAALIARLGEIDAALDSLKADTAALRTRLEKQKKDAERGLEDVAARLASVDSLRALLSDTLGTATDSLRTLVRLAAEKREEWEHKIDSAKALRRSLDSLDAILRGTPKPAELAKLEEVATARTAAEDADSAVARKMREIQSEAEDLAEAIRSAEAALTAATEVYETLERSGETETKKVADLQGLLYADSKGRSYFTARRAWDLAATSFVNTHLAGSASTLAGMQSLVNAAGEAALSKSAAPARLAAAGTFASRMASFDSSMAAGCGGLADAGDRSSCSTALESVRSAAAAYSRALTSAVGSKYKFSPALRDSIDAARKRLALIEPGIDAAAATVAARSADYESAVGDYTTTIDGLESERATLEAAAATSEETLAEREREYRAMVAEREGDLETNRERYLAEKHDLEGTLLAIDLRIDLLSDTVEAIDRDTIRLGELKRDLDRRVDGLDAEKKKLLAVRASLEAILALTFEDLVKGMLAEMAALEKEREEIETKLDELKKQREELGKGTKEAAGAIVYYIPPPLEEVMKKKDEFERLKEAVEVAERELEVAKGEKAALQERLLKQFERVARNLTKYRQSEVAKEELEEEQDDLDAELKTLQNNKTKEYADKQVKLQEILERTEGHRDSAEAYIERALRDSARLEEVMESTRTKIAELDSALSLLRVELKDLQAQLDYEEGLRLSAVNTLQSRLAELQEAKEKLQELEDELARAQSVYTRASARSDVGEGSAEASVREKRTAATTQKTKVETLEAGVASASTSVESAEARTQAAADTLFSRSERYRSDGQELRVWQDSLMALNEQMEEILTGLNYWRAVLEKAERLIEKTNDARDEFRDTVASLVNNDEEVKSKAEKLAEIEKQIEEATRAMEKAEADIALALDKRKELVEEAGKAIEEAEEKLAKAEAELRALLVAEFTTVTFDAKLTVKANDEVIDGFRGDDPIKEITSTITYGGTRIPSLPSTSPTAGLTDIVKSGPCNPNVGFQPPPPLTTVPPAIAKPEPRTIALIYKEGEPLWPEWPVIPSDAPVLSKDVIHLRADGTDSDAFVQNCVSDVICPPPLPLAGTIRDLLSFLWVGEGAFINSASADVLWETPDVPAPGCDKKSLVETKYRAPYIAADAERKEKFRPTIVPGVLIEVPDSIVGAPGMKDTIKVRIVKGDHSGRPGEEVEFSVKLVEGSAKGYGLDGADTVVTSKTDGEGYAKVLFNYGEGYARFKVDVKWKRPGECTKENLYVISPLHLQFLRFTSGPSTLAWDAAKRVWEGRTVKAAAATIPDAKVEELANELYAVAGCWDEHPDSLERVNGIEIGFEPAGGFTVEPEKVKTGLFGIARTVAQDVPEDQELELTASCEKKYEAVCRPPEVERAYNTSKIEKFKIGSPDDFFFIVPDEPIARGEAVNGPATLEINAGGAFIVSLKDLVLQVTDVVLEGEDGETPVAASGTVSWKSGEEKFETTLLGFGIALDSVVIRAGYGAGIGGSVKHAMLENPVSFYAEMNAAGEFYGDVSALPEISVAGFTLKQGTSFAIDMHGGVGDEGIPDPFQGLVIRSAALELPSVFNGREGAATTLDVKNFTISMDDGFAGSVGLEGSFFKIGYAGYEFGADKISLDFADSRLTGGSFTGTISLPSPMEGKLRATIGVAGEKWQADITTDNPVSIPRLQTVFSLRKAGIEWDAEEEVGTLELSAIVSSTKYGDMEIKGFTFNSKGEIGAEKIGINKSIAFGRGFELHVESLSFMLTGAEYGLSLTGGFAIPKIGIDKLDGTVTIAPGPEVSVMLDKAEISFSNGPVEFEGRLEYTGDLFRGEFEVGIKKLAKGIKGTFLVGSQAIDEKSSFTFWYVEMTLPVMIPLGQTGLSLLELGGGVGWNYDPPVGAQEGAPRQSDALSFKAIVGLGNTPRGELFAGRVTMVLVPGRFTVNGKFWLLQKEESMFGEGQLSIHWDPVDKLDGYVRALVGVPDAEGKVFYFNGKINFLYSAADFYIRSETISGSVLKQVQAEATLDITSEHIDMKGRMWYDLNKTISLGIVAAIVDLHISVDGDLRYDNTPSTLHAALSFTGNWDVNLETPVGTYDLLSGSVVIAATLRAAPGTVAFEGSASISYSVLWYSGSASLDVGYSASI